MITVRKSFKSVHRKDRFLMSLFVISDTHLSFSTDKPMDVFGNRWQYYDLKLESAWRDLINENDTVVIGGDVSWAMNFNEALADLRFLNNLPGKKLLCRGNHDYWWSTMSKLRKFFINEQGLESIDFLYNNSFETDDFIICGSRGWFNDSGLAPNGVDYKKIVSREAMRIAMSIEEGKKKAELSGICKEILVFLHFPPIYHEYRCDEIINVLQEYGIQRCYYGHIHNVYDIPQSFFEDGIEFTITSADYLDFYPLKIERLLN